MRAVALHDIGMGLAKGYAALKQNRSNRRTLDWVN